MAERIKSADPKQLEIEQAEHEEMERKKEELLAKIKQLFANHRLLPIGSFKWQFPNCEPTVGTLLIRMRQILGILIMDQRIDDEMREYLLNELDSLALEAVEKVEA